QKLDNTLGEVLSKAGKRQVRIAETEKYAHVTFFFNGGLVNPYPQEERILVPSPQVATYNLQPEMSAVEITDKALEAINSGIYDFMVINYANPDMVGHTGIMDAAVSAIETVDKCLDRLTGAVLSKGGVVVITADHGNAECMVDKQSRQMVTAHTSNTVPFILVGEDLRNLSLHPGSLEDIAPTVLALLGLAKPAEMTGKVLLKDWQT
ncbi:MAG: alkaline phosphatase family protein, partial [Clostridia bacterium]|nr:alkaline phosphatase family protein [Clostridia bacterium]